MTNWTPEYLAAIDADTELSIAAHRDNGPDPTPRVIWHVVVDGQLFARSVRGPTGAWYRHLIESGVGTVTTSTVRVVVDAVSDSHHDDAIDEAYRRKYGTGSAVRAITSIDARSTSLRLDPHTRPPADS